MGASRRVLCSGASFSIKTKRENQIHICRCSRILSGPTIHSMATVVVVSHLFVLDGIFTDQSRLLCRVSLPLVFGIRVKVLLEVHLVHCATASSIIPIGNRWLSCSLSPQTNPASTDIPISVQLYVDVNVPDFG